MIKNKPKHAFGLHLFPRLHVSPAHVHLFRRAHGQLHAFFNQSGVTFNQLFRPIVARFPRLRL